MSVNDSVPRRSPFLRALERITRTDLGYLFRGGFWISVGQVGSSAATFALAIAFANLLPVATYGVYKYMLSIAGFFSVFTLPGMVLAITRSVAQGDVSSIRAATRLRIRWSLVGVAAALIGAAHYYLNANYPLASSLLIIAITLPIFDTFTLYNAYLSGKRDFRRQTYYHLWMQVVSVGALIAALFVSNSIVVILLAYFLPLAAMRFYYHHLIMRRIPIDAAPNQETLTYGKHLSLMNVLSVASQTVDKLLLWHFLGPVQLALYAFAIGIPEQLKGPMKGVGDLALPKFSERSSESMRTDLPLLWYRVTLYGMALVAIVAVYIVIAPYLFAALFPQYIESVLYSQVFALSLITGVTVVPMAALTAHRKTGEQYAINIAQPILQIALFLALIPTYGILGAVVSILMSRVIMTIIVIAATARAFKY